MRKILCLFQADQACWEDNTYKANIEVEISRAWVWVGEKVPKFCLQNILIKAATKFLEKNEQIQFMCGLLKVIHEGSYTGESSDKDVKLSRDV